MGNRREWKLHFHRNGMPAAIVPKEESVSIWADGEEVNVTELLPGDVTLSKEEAETVRRLLEEIKSADITSTTEYDGKQFWLNEDQVHDGLNEALAILEKAKNT